ncbi:hypothetical protein GA0116948_11785 [Chitinophaga costaii]|uniref:Uncharacterized protein n=1 Tax=Chitinophaga costaii TaxID=1335309 RepID=A0A1C4FVV0_9BACT|nr:hypothetical protein [Chitinophaga costaii]PUZ27267.1 hypothetical protein DCM91_08640 [Chitinophaga costaii]SCC60129.1 hypothetical protein GA0116948_11785 [Chitinophaga costaii]
MQVHPYPLSIFINCPFDTEYEPLLQAMVFTIYRCGFVPQCALGEDNATDYRLDKIIRYIRHCQYSIHDLSRVEANGHGLPRLNMPFELGLFFGAKHFGKGVHRQKNALIFERDKYTYLEFITDLRGVDVKAHYNSPLYVIAKIRHWLKSSSDKQGIPGIAVLWRDFEEFQANLPGILQMAGHQREDILFKDLCLIVEQAINNILQARKQDAYPTPDIAPDVVNDVLVPYF